MFVCWWQTHFLKRGISMSLSLVQSRALLGLEAASVTVEVHLANGLPSFTLVGLADVEVKEARERVRSAIQNSGLEFPNNKRITVNLAPADLPKDSGRFDLPIALGILAASGQIDAAQLAGYEFAGELSLSGELRAVRGALAMSLALHASRVVTKLVLPPGSAEEAALVPDTQVYRAQHLLDVVQHFLPQAAEAPAPESANGWSRVSAVTQMQEAQYLDMADVKGQFGAKRALEIAAAGGHSLLLMGPPGAGKSMLAQRFAGLLPPMTTDEALQSAAIASLGGRFVLAQWAQRPTCHPQVRWRWWAAARRRAQARFHWHTTGCCFWMNFPSLRVLPWRPCVSRWKPGASPSHGRRGGQTFRPSSS